MADNINAAGYETKPWWPYVRALMEGGGSVTVEQLNVTENGTYTAPEGKAYSPVVVNVAGGSSDFSTAEVTLVNSASGIITPRPVTLALPENAFGEGAPALAFPFMATRVDPENTVTIQVILYKGKSVIDLSGISSDFDFSVSGDIDTNFVPGMALVTGNGTITFTDKA